MEKVKKLKKNRLIGILITIIGPILWIFVAIKLKANNLVVYIPSILIFFGGIAMYTDNNVELNGLCENCGVSIKGSAYNIQETGRNANTSGDVYADFKFTCKCPKCGWVKTFYKSFEIYTAPRYDSDGNIVKPASSKNPQYLARNEAKRYFE